MTRPRTAVSAAALFFSLSFASPSPADVAPPEGGYAPCSPGSELVHGGAGHRYCKALPVDCSAAGAPACEAGTACQAIDFCARKDTRFARGDQIDDVTGVASGESCTVGGSARPRNEEERVWRRNVCAPPGYVATIPGAATQTLGKGRSGCACVTAPAAGLDGGLLAAGVALGAGVVLRRRRRARSPA